MPTVVVSGVMKGTSFSMATVIDSRSLTAKQVGPGHPLAEDLQLLHAQHAGIRLGGPHAPECDVAGDPGELGDARAIATFSLNAM